MTRHLVSREEITVAATEDNKNNYHTITFKNEDTNKEYTYKLDNANGISKKDIKLANVIEGKVDGYIVAGTYQKKDNEESEKDIKEITREGNNRKI